MPKAKAPKKPSLKNLHLTDGKNRDVSQREQDIEKIKELEVLLGFAKINPYGTANKTLFAEKVEHMTLDDMRSLAMRVGVVPTNRQNEMRKRLLDNFDDYLRQSRQTVVGVTRPGLDPTSKAYDSIKDLLG